MCDIAKSHLTVTLMLLIVAAAAVADESTPSETWFTIQYDDQPVGFEQLKSETVPNSRNRLLACYRKTELNLNRLGRNLTVKASLWTTQTPDGILQSFQLQRIDGSGARIERSGTRSADGRSFRIDERITATRRQYDVPVPPDTRSPITSLWLPALAQQSQDRITVPVFFPESSVVSNVIAGRRPDRRLRLADHSSLDAKRFAFSLQSAPTTSTTLYTTDNLSVIRQEKQFLNRQLSLESTTPELALSNADGKALNLDVQAGIPVNRLLSVAADRQQLVLDLTVTEGFLPSIPDSTFQTVQVIDESTVRVTLTHPKIPGRNPTAASPAVRTPLPATHWMPTDDPVLQRFAVMATSTESDPGLICRRLERFVHSKMKHSAFSATLLPADQVARTLKGDCTEHALLLAALIRTVGIPARIVSGLVHTNRRFGFTGHMWVEAQLDDRWIPFDSTFGLEGVGTTHLKLTDSQMPDNITSGVSLFLPILELAGRTKLQVVSDQ